MARMVGPDYSQSRMESTRRTAVIALGEITPRTVEDDCPDDRTDGGAVSRTLREVTGRCCGSSGGKQWRYRRLRNGLATGTNRLATGTD